MHAIQFIEKGQAVLAEVPVADLLPGHALVRVDGHVAGGRFEHAGEDFHEGRLAGTVGADQAVAVALAELDADVVE